MFGVMELKKQKQKQNNRLKLFDWKRRTASGSENLGCFKSLIIFYYTVYIFVCFDRLDEDFLGEIYLWNTQYIYM